MKKTACLLFFFLLPVSEISAREMPKMFDMEKRNAGLSRFQLSPYIGPYVGDTLSTSYITGLQFAQHWSRHFATAVDFGYSPVEVDPASAYGRTVTDPNLFSMNGAVLFVTPAAVKVSHYKIMEMDLYGLLGGGWLRINRSNLPNGMMGVGGLLYLKPWLALRLEGRGILYRLPIQQGGFSVDAAVLGGPSFLFARSK